MKLQSALSFASAVMFVTLSYIPASAQNCENGVCRMRPQSQPSDDLSPSAQFRRGEQHHCDPATCRACVDGACDQCYECQQFSGRRSGVNNVSYRSDRSYGLTPERRTQPTYRATGFDAPAPRNWGDNLSARSNQEIRWETDFNRGSQRARETGRPMLVRVTADWCGYCTQMKQTTYRQHSIVQDITSAFIPIEIDADANRELIGKMNVKSLPATLVIMPDHRIVVREEGYRTAEQLSNVLHRFTQRAELVRPLTIAVR